MIVGDILYDSEFNEESGLFPSIENILEVMKDNRIVINYIKQFNGRFFTDVCRKGNCSEVQVDENLRESLLKAINRVFSYDQND